VPAQAPVDLAFYGYALTFGFALVPITTLYLLFATAPYGRHKRKGFGPELSNTAAWVIMEAPASLLPLGFYLTAGHFDCATTFAFLLWQAHYVDRAFLYPLRIRGRGAPMPLFVALSGAGFNLLNAYLNFRCFALFGGVDAEAAGGALRIALGALLFGTGWYVNRWADRVLRGLRKPGERGYVIPRGGLYELISCPNYFGELVMWCGFALVAYTKAGLFFALFTAANLVPRAIAHQRDYRKRFVDYPEERRAVIPFVL
jgi:3-oxo-5-alpha-steroid 4-dehydrogenase 1